MKSKGKILFIFVAFLISACAYKVPTAISPALNIYSSYDNKIPGKYMGVIDLSKANLSIVVPPTSFECSAHKFPLDVQDTMSASIERTLEKIFDDIQFVSGMPSQQNLGTNKVKGVVRISVDSFRPRVSCSMGYYSANCTATADVSFGIIVSGKSGRLLATSVGSTRSATGSGGMACEGAAKILGEATSNAIREGMERLGERLSNARRLRVR